MNRSTVVSNGCGSKGPTQALAEGINRMDEVPRFALLILYRERAVWKLQIDRTLYKRRSSQLSKQPNQSWRWRLRCGAGLGHAHTQNTLKPFQLCIEQAEIGWQQAASAPDTHIPPIDTYVRTHTEQINITVNSLKHYARLDLWSFFNCGGEKYLPLRAAGYPCRPSTRLRLFDQNIRA